MMDFGKNWLGQVTTGHGVMILAPTLMAVLGGQLTWAQAAPLILGGVVGLIWPENAGLKDAAQNAVGALEGVATAYLKGVDHGNAAAAPAPSSGPDPASPVKSST